MEIKEHVISGKRRVRVLLPDTYSTQPVQRYPVVYFHDGQNVFFDAESYSGHSWRVIPMLERAAEPFLRLWGCIIIRKRLVA